MRVTVVNQHLSDAVGGSELQCDLVATGLAHRGHDVTYVAVGGLASESGAGAIPASPTRRYTLVPVGRSADAIVAGCIGSRPDVVYWRFNRSLLRDVVAGLAPHGIPLVFAVAHADDVSRWPVRPWPTDATPRDRLSDLAARWRERRTWSAFRRVAAIASQRADLLQRAPTQRQLLIRNLMSEERDAFTWPRPYIAWVGSIQQRKRPELLPLLAATVEPLGVDVIVAGALREERYRALLERPRAPMNLHHVGVLRVAEVNGLLEGARLLAMTAAEEGFANVLIQAWWYGTPVVSLDYDPDGLIRDHGLGIVCGGDRTRFADAVRTVAGPRSAEDETVDEDRRRTRDFARAEFASAPTLDRLESLLEDVAAGQ
jgi:glycosyltransferase involved in cell wall biosynthesis